MFLFLSQITKEHLINSFNLCFLFSRQITLQISNFLDKSSARLAIEWFDLFECLHVLQPHDQIANMLTQLHLNFVLFILSRCHCKQF